jgi:hypothetical protein
MGADHVRHLDHDAPVRRPAVVEGCHQVAVDCALLRLGAGFARGRDFIASGTQGLLLDVFAAQIESETGLEAYAQRIEGGRKAAIGRSAARERRAGQVGRCGQYNEGGKVSGTHVFFQKKSVQQVAVSAG